VGITFETRDRDGLARIGRLSTAHGTVTTPTLLPVVNPNLRTIEPAELHRMGFGMVITNAYVIRSKPELALRARQEGVHKLLGFPGPVMTDSGTFQMYVYGDVEVTNREIVEFQRDIGVDVGTILDLFSTPDRTHAQARADVDGTVERAREAVPLAGGMGLSMPVQGSVHPDLREACARAYRDLPAVVHPIGGVVPLMEQQRYAELAEAILAAKRGLRHGRPVHLFGAGHPMMFPLAALLGCDLFDSAGYGKFARDGRLMMSWGTVHLADLEELPCACAACAGTTPAELWAMPAAQREARIARHNLLTAAAELARIREAIRRGRLWELVEERSRAHPSLLSALRAVAGHAEWLERFEPLSRPSALLYTGRETLRRPSVLRARRRLSERLTFPGAKEVALLPARGKPFSSHWGMHWAPARSRGLALACPSIFGPVPLEADEIWPFSQSVELPEDVGEESAPWNHAFASSHDLALVPVPPELAQGGTEGFDAARVRATIEYQFGREAAGPLLAGKMDLVKARNGRIRNVLVDGEHILSIRAEDGLATLRLPGARRLHAVAPPALRVTVTDDAIPFVRDGKSVFARFVQDADPELRPFDECLIVDARDRLLGHGVCLLNREEMLDAERGMCVKVREGVGSA